MRQLRSFYLMSLITLLGCKEQPAPLTFFERQYLKNFKIDGIEQENISVSDGSIVVSLPLDYKGGEKIKVSFDNWEKILAQTGNSLGEWKNGYIVYEGNEVTVNSTNLYVVPKKPLEIIPHGEPYRFKLTGKDTYLSFFVRNWGTRREPYEHSNEVKLIHKESGSVILAGVNAKPPLKEGDLTPLSVRLDRRLPTGEYNVLIYRRGKEIKLPDALILEYGDPLVLYDYKPVVHSDTAQILIRGYNFLPQHKYELTLNNDFDAPIKLPLVVKSANLLSVDLPKDLEPGNYAKEIRLNEIKLSVDNLTKSDNLLVVQNQYAQPQLISLTHISQSYEASQGFSAFKPLTSFKRNQEILAIFLVENMQFWKGCQLHLTNVDTKQAYMSSGDDGSGYFPNLLFIHLNFPIPADCPPGKYSVRLSCIPDGVTTYSSERYHRIITIE